MERSLTAVYVAIDPNTPIPHKIYGYFSLNSYSLYELTEENELNFQPYGYIPAILIGKLAKAQNQDKLDGSDLLGQALLTAKEISKSLGVALVLVQPIDDFAANFYTDIGFLPVSEKSTFMYYPISEIT